MREDTEIYENKNTIRCIKYRNADHDMYKLKEFMNSKIYVISTICTSKTLWAQGSSYLRIYEGKNIYTQESTINQQQESTRTDLKICAWT